MNRLFQHQEHKKANGIHQRQSKDSRSTVSYQMHPFHSAILNLQQTYGNRYVQGFVEGDRIPCRELCGQDGPSLTTHLAPHSCGSCPFHTRSIKQMTPGTPSSSSTQPIQAKLKIGKPGDMYEQEADRVADMVLQRQCSSPECEEEETVQRQTITPLIQRQIESEEEEEEPIQMKQMAPEKEVSQDVDEQILQQRGIGRLLEPETRKFMEARLGYDFDGVRIHTDSYAQRKSNELNAEAFTIGRDVFFNAGRYNPSATEGKRLLAHELTHVVQQEGGKRLLAHELTHVVQKEEGNIIQRECDVFCPNNSAATAGTANFHINEFACRDGTPVPEKYRGNLQILMNQLEILRTELGDNSITINSGYRTCAYNAGLEGAASRSRHLCAQAADIRVRNHDAQDVYNTIQDLIEAGRMIQGGLGLYANFVHYDVRGTRARW